MTDLEKVLKGIECCLAETKWCHLCPYRGCTDQETTDPDLLRDAQKLLCAQPHIVKCEECTHWDQKSGLSARWCETWKAYTSRWEYCNRGRKRKDD